MNFSSSAVQPEESRDKVILTLTLDTVAARFVSPPFVDRPFSFINARNAAVNSAPDFIRR